MEDEIFSEEQRQSYLCPSYAPSGSSQGQFPVQFQSDLAAFSRPTGLSSFWFPRLPSVISSLGEGRSRLEVCLQIFLSEAASTDFVCLHSGRPRLSVSTGEGWVLREMPRASMCGWRRMNSETGASDLTTCPFIRKAFYLSYTQTHTHIPMSATCMSG